MQTGGRRRDRSGNPGVHGLVVRRVLCSGLALDVRREWYFTLLFQQLEHGPRRLQPYAPDPVLVGLSKPRGDDPPSQTSRAARA